MGKQLLHERRLLVCAADLCGHKAVVHGLLHAVDKLRLLVEAITHAVVDTIHLALDVGKIGGQDVAVHDTGTGVAHCRPSCRPSRRRKQTGTR